MTTLFFRLLEICRDQGVKLPQGKDIQRIAGISSGRVTQIKQGEGGAKLGAQALSKLIELGYRPDWIQFGLGDMKQIALTDQEKKMIQFFRELSDEDKIRVAHWVITEAAMSKSKKSSDDLIRYSIRDAG